jgi:hypothetical protein
MANERKSVPVGPRRLLTAGLLLLAGCAGPRGNEIDPLTGGQPLPRGGSGTSAVAGGVGIAQPVPLPAPSAATSQAALAAGVNPSLDSGRDLRIGVKAVSTGDSGTGRTTGTQGGAILRGPEPANGSAPRADSTPPVGVTTPPVTLASGSGPAEEYRQLQAQLQARGVTWQRLETWGENGDWKFSCSIPYPNNPNTRHNINAIARGDLAAIRAALEQIDQEKH